MAIYSLHTEVVVVCGAERQLLRGSKIANIAAPRADQVLIAQSTEVMIQSPRDVECAR